MSFLNSKQNIAYLCCLIAIDRMSVLRFFKIDLALSTGYDALIEICSSDAHIVFNFVTCYLQKL